MAAMAVMNSAGSHPPAGAVERIRSASKEKNGLLGKRAWMRELVVGESDSCCGNWDLEDEEEEGAWISAAVPIFDSI